MKEIKQRIEIPDAPDAPPVLTVEALIAQGLARRISTSKSGHHVQIHPEGHAALGANQRERAEANVAWRERSTDADQPA